MFFVAFEISNMSCVFKTIADIMLVPQLNPVSALLTYRLMITRVFVSPDTWLDFVFFGALRAHRRSVTFGNFKILATD